MKKLSVVVALVLSLSAVSAFATGLQMASPDSVNIVQILNNNGFQVFHGVDMRSISITDLQCTSKTGMVPMSNEFCQATDSNGLLHNFNVADSQALIKVLTDNGVKTHTIVEVDLKITSFDVPQLTCNAGILSKFQFICRLPMN